MKIEQCSTPMTIFKGSWKPRTELVHDDTKFHFPIGSEVEYDCIEGHKLVGAKILECTSDKMWSKIAPSCIPEDGL